MKQSELRQVATCAVCGKKIGETGLPLFYLFTIERHGVDMRAVNRQTGLEMMLGHPVLAAVMGPDDDMTYRLMEPIRITICEPCSMESIEPARLAEIANEQQRKAG